MKKFEYKVITIPTNISFSTKGGRMRNNIGKIFLCSVIICVIVATFLCFNGDIGIPKSKIQSDIRTSQKIQTEWSIEGMASETMAAYISYPQDKSDHTFSVYVNRPGISFGYFFRGGGDLVAVDKYISEFTVDGCNERAFISMNLQKINRLEIDDGNNIELLEINSETPFAIVLPVNAGNITFYNIDGEVVEFVNNPL